LSEEEQESGDGPGWKDHVAFEASITGLEGAGCCLLSLLHAFALFLIPVSALLLLNR
jgi:hypothetical protein